MTENTSPNFVNYNIAIKWNEAPINLLECYVNLTTITLHKRSSHVKLVTSIRLMLRLSEVIILK